MHVTASTLEYDVPSLADLQEAVGDPEKAIASLPEQDRDAYRDAQESVIEARRRAETTEGLLQIN
jgi:hypothetical protein